MKRRTLRAVLAVTATLFAAPAAEAHASLVEFSPCDGAPLSKPFTQWADAANYKLVPGGDFEGDLSGWTLARGAHAVAGGEPWAVTGQPGSRALALAAGASAVTPATCVNAGAPTLRFFARSTGGVLPLLKVDLLYRDGLFRHAVIPVGVVLPGSAWRPTLPMLTASAVAAALAGGEADLSMRLTAVSGHWQVDDVFVDPYARR